MTTPRERLAALLDEYQKITTVVLGSEALAQYLISHGWRESGQAGELDTSTAAASDATVASAQPSVVSASPAPSLEARETWWLIEWPPKANVNEFSLWLAQRQGGGCHAGSDVNQAIRFRSKGDAESVVRGLLKAEHGWAGAIVTEHMWMDGDLTALEGQYAGTWAHPLRTVNPPAPVEAREPLSDRDCEVIRRRLYDAGWYRYDMGNDDIRAVASALRGEG